MAPKHMQRQRDLLERAMDRVWHRAASDPVRSEVDLKLIADAKLANWVPPPERGVHARKG